MKTRGILGLCFLALFIMLIPIHTLANSQHTEKIDYTKNHLVPTLEQGAKKNPPPPPPSKNIGDSDDSFLDKAKKLGKKLVTGTVDGFKTATKVVKETTSDILDSASDYWEERSLFEKSLIIVGTIATVVTLGAAAGIISAGAAVTMGAMGALNYGLYAMTADNVTFGGGLLWGGLGMAGGALGMAARGAKFLAPARAFVSRATIPALGRLGTFLPAVGAGAALSSGTAVYTHLAKWAITGEPPNWGDMGRDALVWGAAGAVGGGAFSAVSKAASRFMSKGKSIVAGGVTAGGSETAVSDWLQGNKVTLKKVAIGATAGAVLTGALVALPNLGNKPVNQAINKTEVTAESIKAVAPKRTPVDKLSAGTGYKVDQPVLPLANTATDPYTLLKQNGIPQTFTDSELAMLRAADMRMELQVGRTSIKNTEKIRVVDGKKQYNVNGKWLTDKQFSVLRQKAVRQSWKQEKDLVLKTGRGTREWTSDELTELITTGKVKGYEGQHMKSANEYPDFAGEPDNIQFLKGRNMDVNEHLDAHGGSYHNPTNGYYLPQPGIMVDFGDKIPWIHK
ncbi:hypothetical protein P8610_12270 [Fictibacillus sp. UD]|uniref:hypothetical protein n=1 Tax=Fictibacillus sp. UD TaxID=3038777 RepID=UPI003745D364